MRMHKGNKKTLKGTPHFRSPKVTRTWRPASEIEIVRLFKFREKDLGPRVTRSQELQPMAL